MPLYGLVGKTLVHSFSRNYFLKKFESENISNSDYVNFEIADIEDIINIVSQNENLCGLNITVPYKSNIIPFLDKVDNVAQTINAVNTVVIQNKKLTGHNTDWIGFKTAVEKFTNGKSLNALILGTGGSALAVEYVLKMLEVSYLFVSRNPVNDKSIAYHQLNQSHIFNYPLIVNCTPLGKIPHTSLLPPLPYHLLTNSNFLFDLNYNPSVTAFMQKGIQCKANVTNGLYMLQVQAEESWKIWNKQTP